jgi:hypothetical protein
MKLTQAVVVGLLGVGSVPATAAEPGAATSSIPRPAAPAPAGDSAQPQPPATMFDPARHMRVSEVKPGMTGHGLSVFSGTKVERFDVEVISVLRNFNPKADVILIRCRGQNLEHTAPWRA